MGGQQYHNFQQVSYPISPTNLPYLPLQAEAPASLAIGTQVSAKYKGAFCEATVRSVNKQVRIRVTFRNGLGSSVVGDEFVRSEGAVQVGAAVKARHPDTLEYVDAVVNKIQVWVGDRTAL